MLLNTEDTKPIAIVDKMEASGTESIGTNSAQNTNAIKNTVDSIAVKPSRKLILTKGVPIKIEVVENNSAS